METNVNMFNKFLDFIKDRFYLINGLSLILIETIIGLDLLISIAIGLLVFIYSIIKLQERIRQNKHNEILRILELEKIKKQMEDIIDKGENKK